LRQQDNATIRMPGYSGSSTANVVTYLAGRNTHERSGNATGTVIAVDASKYQSASSCPTPP